MRALYLIPGSRRRQSQGGGAAAGPGAAATAAAVAGAPAGRPGLVVERWGLWWSYIFLRQGAAWVTGNVKPGHSLSD